MLTLASYPRSGNTFLRNVLYEVYGIESATYLTAGRGPDENWPAYPVVKTHLLPHELPAELADRPTVYLIRDGRDSAVSCAHYWRDIVNPESTYEQNLEELSYAAEGSYFGGWSEHTTQWIKRADLVIRFEDLVADPLGQCERLRPFLDLPNAQPEKLPDFKDLKTGEPEYGSGKGKPVDNLANKWFRRGKIGSWKDEMTEEQHDLFWHMHGEAFDFFGYRQDGSRTEDFPVSAEDTSRASVSYMSVAIEAAKLRDPFVDGIKRYVHELSKAALRWPVPGIDFHLWINGERHSLTAETLAELDTSEHTPITDGVLGAAKQTLKTVLPKTAYNSLARAVPMSRVRGWIKPSRVASGERASFEKVDVIHLTLPQHFDSVKKLDTSVVATIHDLTHLEHPEHHEENNISLTTQGMRWLQERQASLITVSKATQSDLAESGSSSTVIHEGVDRSVFYPVRNNPHLLGLVRERYQLPKGDFLLSVCTLEPRKNLSRLIEAYAQLSNALREKHPLVLAGRKGWKWSNDIVPEHCREQVHFTGFVREDHLPALYTLAHGFCYVSLYEGFGLPVLEAMACACPVMVSNTTSLPEVAGDAGIYANPLDVDSIQQALIELLEHPEHAKLKQRAMRQSWKFMWSRCLQRTVEVYRQAAGGGGGGRTSTPQKTTTASSQTAD